MKKLGFLATSGDGFCAPIMAHLGQRFEVRNLLEKRGDEGHVEWPAGVDLFWSDWADDALVKISQAPKVCPIIARCHSFEAFSPFPERIRWRAVDALIFVAEHVRDLVLSKWPQIAEQTDVRLIHNGVDLERFKPPAHKEHHGQRIAWVGGINAKKGPMLFAQVAQALPDYEFHVAGAWQDERFRIYLEHLALENVTYHGHVEDMPAFYADKDFILSTSPWESFQYSVAEGIACGLIPLVHDWPAAETIWGGDTWRTLDDLKFFLRQSYPSESEVWRRELAEHYDLPDRLAEIDAVVDEVMARDIFPTVGGIMIVKGDETDRLRKSIASFHDHVDDLVVAVDTRHGTEAIGVAESFEKARVFTQPFDLYHGHIDFSTNRNRTISESTADWLFIVDADEEVQGAQNLKSALWQAKIDGFDAVACQVNCYVNSGLAEEAKDVRLFKNNGKIHWRYPAHNQLRGMTKTFGTDSLAIRSSYEGDGALKGRCDRTIPILELMWEEAETFEDPKDAKEHAAFFLCRMFAADNRHEGTKKWAAICKDLCVDTPGRMPFWTWWVQATLLTDGEEKAREILNEGLARYPNHGDLLYYRMAMDALDWGQVITDPKQNQLVPMHSRQHRDKLPQMVELMQFPIKVEVAE